MSSNSWNATHVAELFEMPFFELISQAYSKHKEYFSPTEMEYCTLLSIKTGTCPEDCAYCPQSGHYNTGLKKEKLLNINLVIEQAAAAKRKGAKRFCMGAAWRNPPKKEFPQVLDMIKAVKSLGLETCVTLGMLNKDQAVALKEAGLDFYNHNLDTSEQFYKSIITTRTYEDRFETLKNIIDADINVCCGGILGMGESRTDRIELLIAISRLPRAPKSIPINKLITVKGTPLEHAQPLDHFEFIRTIAVTRLMFPASRVRLSAGREGMADTVQAWCFMAGANSIFIGDKLLTAKNPSQHQDIKLLDTLGMQLPVHSECHDYVT